MLTKLHAMELDLREIHYFNPELSTFCHKYRRNGKTKIWKTRPNEVKVPIKHGLYDYAYLTHENANKFYLPEECKATHK